MTATAQNSKSSVRFTLSTGTAGKAIATGFDDLVAILEKAGDQAGWKAGDKRSEKGNITHVILKPGEAVLGVAPHVTGTAKELLKIVRNLKGATGGSSGKKQEVSTRVSLTRDNLEILLDEVIAAAMKSGEGRTREKAAQDLVEYFKERTDYDDTPVFESIRMMVLSFVWVFFASSAMSTQSSRVVICLAIQVLLFSVLSVLERSLSSISQPATLHTTSFLTV
jgi:hypothetical protein